MHHRTALFKRFTNEKLNIKNNGASHDLCKYFSAEANKFEH